MKKKSNNNILTFNGSKSFSLQTFLLPLLLLLFFYSNAQVPSKKLEINHLTDNFYIFTSYNTFNGNPFPSNGMYLNTEEGVILFDTPWDTTQFQPLLDSIEKRHKKMVIMCISTHSHDDRTAGLEYYDRLGIKTYTTKQTDSISILKNEKRARYLIDKDSTFTFGDYSFQTYYPGEGHAPDNIIIWFEKFRIIYGGCMIKSTDAVNLGNLTDANITEWYYSLQKLQKKFPKAKFVIPGHQNWTNKKALKHTLKLVSAHLKRK